MKAQFRFPGPAPPTEDPILHDPKQKATKNMTRKLNITKHHDGAESDSVPSTPDSDNQNQAMEAFRRYMRQAITLQIPAALTVLRREMCGPRSSPATRVRAAQIILDAALRVAGSEDERAELAKLEMLDPQKAALARLTPKELRSLQQFTMDREEGNDLQPCQIAVARKHAAEEQEIRALKVRRLSKR